MNAPPQRALLRAVLDTLGDVPVSLSCDLTKLYGEAARTGIGRAGGLWPMTRWRRGSTCWCFDLCGTARQQEAVPLPFASKPQLLDLLAGTAQQAWRC